MATEHRISGLILAAGEGRRFGGLKQLEKLGPRHVMQYAVDAMLDVDLIDRVAVTVGAGAGEVVSTIDLDGVEVVDVPDWDEGMAASLRAGVAALADRSDAVVVTLADQPLISAPMITMVIEAWDGVAPAVRATHEGAPGHPVLLSAELFPAVAGLTGESGARELIGPDPVAVECGPNAIYDVDTVEQLQDLRDSAVGGETD